MKPAVRLEDYPLRSFDKLRYGDTDRQGHVNNAVFSTFLETGRVEMVQDGEASLLDDGCSFVIARLELDFVSEMLWPGRVDIGSGVLSVGRSSIRMEQALFQGGRLLALAETVMVQVSDATRRSQAFSERLLARLAPYRKGQPGAAQPPG
jgi:acyl-CoA thioester hydrolase